MNFFANRALEQVKQLPGKWLNGSLLAIIEEQVQLPVALINDLRATTLGEWIFGTGRGGGVVVNGRFHLGIVGTAGEFGHQVVEVDGLPCGRNAGVKNAGKPQ